jgi:hypothetical protein
VEEKVDDIIATGRDTIGAPASSGSCLGFCSTSSSVNAVVVFSSSFVFGRLVKAERSSSLSSKDLLF